MVWEKPSLRVGCSTLATRREQGGCEQSTFPQPLLTLQGPRAGLILSLLLACDAKAESVLWLCSSSRRPVEMDFTTLCQEHLVPQTGNS